MTKTLKILFSFICVCVFSSGYAFTNSSIFIMLNIDATIVDRIDPSNKTFMENLLEEGFDCQKLSFIATKESSPKFLNIYEKISKKECVKEESEYLTRIAVEKLDSDEYRITEYVVIRPTIKYLLEEIKEMGFPLNILLTSRNDDARTKNLHKYLNLKIAGKTFEKSTIFIPSDRFRFKIRTKDLNEISVKSSIELRKNYPIIKPNDIVILLDHIKNSRFITSQENPDFNIFVSKFIIKRGYDYKQDLIEMENILLQIKRKIKMIMVQGKFF